MSGTPNARYRLVAFDLDGTLVLEKSSWETIHRHFNSVESAKESLRLYTDGRIDYTEFMRRDLASWPRSLHLSTIDRLLSDYTLRDGAREVIGQLHEWEVKVVLISAGISLLADRVAAELGISCVRANSLHTDESGYLTGSGNVAVDPLKKDEVLSKIALDLGIDLRETIAVGDTIYDKGILKASRLGFIIGDKRVAKEIGVDHIDNLSEILAFLDHSLAKT